MIVNSQNMKILFKGDSYSFHMLDELTIGQEFDGLQKSLGDMQLKACMVVKSNELFIRNKIGDSLNVDISKLEFVHVSDDISDYPNRQFIFFVEITSFNSILLNMKLALQMQTLHLRYVDFVLLA